MKKTISLICLGATAFTAVALTNNIQGLYDKTKAPTADQPILCVKDADGGFVPWAAGAVLPSQFDANDFGAAVRTGGCDQSNIYFGWLQVTDGQASYTPDAGSHIVLQDVAISGDSLNGHLGYTVIGQPDTASFPTNPQTTRPDWFAGVNLSGLEFSTMPNAMVIPSLASSDAATDNTDLKATATFLNQGANIIRLPIRWAYMQPYGVNDSTDLDQNYFNDLVAPTLETITSHGYYAILDLHNYMHYSTVGNEVAGCGGPDGQCPDGTLLTDGTPVVKIWSAIWQAIQADKNIKPDHLFLDVMNEPATQTQGSPSPKAVFDTEVAVIKQLEQSGYTGYYLLEGTDWTGMHSWVESGNAAQFTRANFQAAGLSDDVINRIVMNVHQYLDADFSGTHDQCVNNITSADNLDAFVKYLSDNQFKAMITEFGVGDDEASCKPALNDFLTQVQKNQYSAAKGYGFIGWTAWSTGHGWGAYNLRIQPDDWKDTVLKSYFKG